MNSEFVADMTAFAKAADKSLADTAVAITTNLFTSVILSTPVGNPTIWADQQHAQWAVENGYTGGRARGNWQFSLRVPAQGWLPLSGEAGEAAASGLMAALPNTVVVGEVNYLTNNLPYISRLEYDGWSSQSPEGMVRKNMARITAAINAIVRENAL